MLSVIVCTYNRERLLANCLDALVGQMQPFADTTEVIVIDNNSTDRTCAVVQEYRSRYHWLRYVHEHVQGLSHARNRGAIVANGAYLGYLDDDAKPSPSYLLNVHRVIQDHQPDIFGGPVYPYYTTPKPSWFLDAFETRRHAPVSGFADCSISGGNFLIRAELLRGLGMFPSGLGMVGRKVRLGEERAVLEEYRRRVPHSEQRVFYSLECFVYHHVPPAKMHMWYVLRRGYFGGKASVVVKHESARGVPRLLRRLAQIWLRNVPGLLFRGRLRSEQSILTMQRGAIIAGKIVQHLQNVGTGIWIRNRKRVMAVWRSDRRT